MELFINDTLVGVTPQKSDTIQTLLTVVSKELDKDLIIATMIVDGVYRSIEDPAVLGIHISDVNKIELTVATRIEIGVSLVEEGKNFLVLGAQECKNGSLAKRLELMSSFTWIVDSLDALKSSVAFPPTDISILRAIMVQIIKQLDQENMSLDKVQELGIQLEQLVDLFEVLKHKLLNEKQFSKESTYALLEEILLKLPEIATGFQTGNDLYAIQELCKIIDTIEIFVRFAATVPEDTVVEQHTLVLKDISLQMLQAFENKDFVLIADLIEYDLSEHIESIVSEQ